MKKRHIITVFFAIIYCQAIFAQTPQEYLKSLGVKGTGELESFSQRVKTVRLNSDTPDDVVRKLGEPSGKSKMGGVDTWQYQFMSVNVSDIMNGKNRVITAYIQFDDSDKVSCIKVTKQIGMTQEDVFTKGEFLMAKPQKSTEPKQPPRADASTKPPENPTEGQTYFNKTDKHFYGWDGKDWKQLDK